MGMNVIPVEPIRKHVLDILGMSGIGALKGSQTSSVEGVGNNQITQVGWPKVDEKDMPT